MRKDLFVRFLVLVVLALGTQVFGQSPSTEKAAVLESRVSSSETGDNYANATFSFEIGANGLEAQKLTRNDWDIQFSSIRKRDGTVVRDMFQVTMVTDDRSRIMDLGEREWADIFEVPTLPAYEKPTREKDVDAIVGHIYLVHTADRDSDFYSLFRVEKLESGKSVTVTWKLIPEPQEK